MSLIAVNSVLDLAFPGLTGVGGTPSSAATAFWDRMLSKDQVAVDEITCSADLRTSAAYAEKTGTPRAIGDLGVTAYQLGETTRSDSTHAIVWATFTLSAGGSTLFGTPMLLEHGRWTMCFAESPTKRFVSIEDFVNIEGHQPTVAPSS